MTADIERGKVGMLFEDFLKELGVCKEVTEQAARRVLEFLRAKEISQKWKWTNSLKRCLHLQMSRIHTR